MFRHHTRRGSPRRLARGSIDHHQGSNPLRPGEDLATTSPPRTPVPEAVSLAFRLLRSSALSMGIDRDSNRPSLAENKLQKRLNSLECTFNEIRSSKNTSIALQEEGSSQQNVATGPSIRVPADRAALREADERNFCFYIRISDDNRAYHRALYVQERTMNALIVAIQQKIPVARERNFVLYLLDSEGARLLVDADVLDHLPDGQDFVMEFGSGVMDKASQSPSPPNSAPSLPDSGFYSPSPLETLERQSLDEYFDFESFLTDIPHHTQRKLPEIDTNVASINGVNCLDLTSGFLESPDTMNESQLCACSACEGDDLGEEER